jgi:gamma-glutamyltranspeptidase/glutathione hydrolase
MNTMPFRPKPNPKHLAPGSRSNFSAAIRTWASTTVVAVALAVPAFAQRQAVEASHGMVTSAHYLASEAGVEILRQGGNAVDAAVATGLALAVTFPSAGNIGGGGFMVLHLAGDGTPGSARDIVIDYRETAPATATRDMYVGPDGQLRKGPGSSTVGWSASGVPGTIAGFALALEKYGSGKVSWADVCEPARRLAAEGHLLTQGEARFLRSSARHLGQFDESRKIYLKGGQFRQAGERWVQADLGETFARLQQHGPREFYEGETARRIATAMAQHGGNITLTDLRAYKPVERVPLRGHYRGYDVVTMPPPSSGGIALLQMLAMLEPFDVGALGNNSAAKFHLFAEVMKRAFRDRAEYLGDPDFVKVPVEQLLAPAYLRHRMADFSPDRATPAVEVKPGLIGLVGPGVRPEKLETTQFDVVDAAGNAVSNTYTLNGSFGSGVTIPGTGILMNNEMDDFTSRPGEPNAYGLIQGEANTIAPGKRPLSSMTPTLVFKDGKLFLVTGSPGGPTIINTVFEIITNVIDHAMPVMQAVEAPRFHNQWMPDVITAERFCMSPDTIALLTARGHTVKQHQNYEGAFQGDGETIGIDPKSGLLLGAADPRRSDARAVGY